MATSMPVPPKARIPVALPPDPHMFMKRPPRPTALGVPQTNPCNSVNPETSAERPFPQQPSPPSTGANPPKPPHANNPATAPSASTEAAAVDHRHIAMASRIASYYQQRCQAVAYYQHQRCQEWANAYRQHCQKMMQAATVVVAWYIRQRIARRRRRRRRVFRRGLASRSAVADAGAGGGTGKAGRVTKGESVRRWVMNVPPAESGGRLEEGDDEPTAAARTLPADREEEEFDMDRELPADEDAELFNMADNLIKSHLAKVDVPMLGVLSFDESGSESESESKEEEFIDCDDAGEAEGGDSEEEYEDKEGGEVDDDLGGRVEEPTPNSEDAQLGTTIKGSRKRLRSSVS